MSDPSVAPALAAHREALAVRLHDAVCDCVDGFYGDNHGGQQEDWRDMATEALTYFADPAHGLTVETGAGIRALHERVRVPEHHRREGAPPDLCRTCWDHGRGWYAIWPCPTIAALDALPAHGLTVETGAVERMCARHPIAPAERCPWCDSERLDLAAHGLVRDEPSEDERCRVCGGTNGQHDGATHDARVTDMPIPARSDDGRTAVEPCHRAEHADHCPACPGPEQPPVPSGVAVDPYCPWHGTKPTAYDTCSCEHGITPARRSAR